MVQENENGDSPLLFDITTREMGDTITINKWDVLCFYRYRIKGQQEK